MEHCDLQLHCAQSSDLSCGQSLLLIIAKQGVEQERMQFSEDSASNASALAKDLEQAKGVP